MLFYSREWGGEKDRWKPFPMIVDNMDPIDEIAIDGLKLLAKTKTGKFYQLTTYQVMNANDK